MKYRLFFIVQLILNASLLWANGEGVTAVAEEWEGENPQATEVYQKISPGDFEAEMAVDLPLMPVQPSSDKKRRNSDLIEISEASSDDPEAYPSEIYCPERLMTATNLGNHLKGLYENGMVDTSSSDRIPEGIFHEGAGPSGHYSSPNPMLTKQSQNNALIVPAAIQNVSNMTISRALVNQVVSKYYPVTLNVPAMPSSLRSFSPVF